MFKQTAFSHEMFLSLNLRFIFVFYIFKTDLNVAALSVDLVNGR